MNGLSIEEKITLKKQGLAQKASKRRGGRNITIQGLAKKSRKMDPKGPSAITTGQGDNSLQFEVSGTQNIADPDVDRQGTEVITSQEVLALAKDNSESILQDLTATFVDTVDTISEYLVEVTEEAKVADTAAAAAAAAVDTKKTTEASNATTNIFEEGSASDATTNIFGEGSASDATTNICEDEDPTTSKDSKDEKNKPKKSRKRKVNDPDKPLTEEEKIYERVKQHREFLKQQEKLVDALEAEMKNPPSKWELLKTVPQFSVKRLSKSTDNEAKHIVTFIGHWLWRKNVDWFNRDPLAAYPSNETCLHATNMLSKEFQWIDLDEKGLDASGRKMIVKKRGHRRIWDSANSISRRLAKEDVKKLKKVRSEISTSNINQFQNYSLPPQESKIQKILEAAELDLTKDSYGRWVPTKYMSGNLIGEGGVIQETRQMVRKMNVDDPAEYGSLAVRSYIPYASLIRNNTIEILLSSDYLVLLSKLKGWDYYLSIMADINLDFGSLQMFQENYSVLMKERFNLFSKHGGSTNQDAADQAVIDILKEGNAHLKDLQIDVSIVTLMQIIIRLEEYYKFVMVFGSPSKSPIDEQKEVVRRKLPFALVISYNMTTSNIVYNIYLSGSIYMTCKEAIIAVYIFCSMFFIFDIDPGTGKRDGTKEQLMEIFMTMKNTIHTIGYLCLGINGEVMGGSNEKALLGRVWGKCSMALWKQFNDTRKGSR